jgi:hypothetical protein
LIRSAVPVGRLDSEYFTGLNHIFINAAEGSNGSEMAIGSHVSDQVIGRITSWITKNLTVSDTAIQAVRK